MKKIFVFSLLFFLPIYLTAQVNLANRNCISISGGTVLNNSSSTVVGVKGVDAELNALGILNYEHHFSNEWAIGISAGLYSASSSVSYLGVSSISVFPVLVEVTYYPESMMFGNSLRGYAGVGLGFYTAKGDKVGAYPALVSSVNESVIGIRPNIGIDYYITDWLKIGPNLAYHVMGDFNEVVGERDNYGGPAFSLRLGVTF